MADILVEFVPPYMEMAEKVQRALAQHFGVSRISDRVYIVGPLRHPQEAKITIMVQGHEAVADEFFREVAEFFATHCEFASFRELVKGLQK